MTFLTLLAKKKEDFSNINLSLFFLKNTNLFWVPCIFFCFVHKPSKIIFGSTFIYIFTFSLKYILVTSVLK